MELRKKKIRLINNKEAMNILYIKNNKTLLNRLKRKYYKFLKNLINSTVAPKTNTQPSLQPPFRH